MRVAFSTRTRLIPQHDGYFTFANPVGTAKRMATSLNITIRSAQQNIEKLMQEGMLNEITGRQRNRVYRANGLFSIVDAPTAGD